MQKIIKKLYMQSTVQLEMGKEKCEIEYNTGVQQGDNMAPILFLYVIQAGMETLHKSFPSTNFNTDISRTWKEKDKMEDYHSNQIQKQWRNLKTPFNLTIFCTWMMEPSSSKQLMC